MGAPIRRVYVLINGAFGVGKTTVARVLRRRLPGAVLFDPEPLGLILQKRPGYSRSDFQHLRSWRGLTIYCGRAMGAVWPIVIVPMTFSQPAYLAEVSEGFAATGRPVLHFCLTAPLAVVRDRLVARGEPAHDPRWSWVHRRAAECCDAHQSAEFAVHIPTVGRSPQEIADELATRVSSRAA